MDQEFINRRIKEQVAYIFDISNSVSIDSKRQVELIKSAEGQLEYFKNQLFNIEKQKMNKSLRQVAEFHQLFEHPVGRMDVLEPLKTRQLRDKLLFEEGAELSEASDTQKTHYDLCKAYIEKIDNKYAKLAKEAEEKGLPIPVLADGDNVDKVEELDALCDIQYVLNGKVLTAGLAPVFEAGCDLVHSNNMTKAHRDHAHCLETVEHLKLTGEWRCVEKDKDVWMLYNSDAKLTKPHDHIKVSLEPIIQAFLKGEEYKAANPKPAVEIARDEIAAILKDTNCELGIVSGKRNHEFEKFANRSVQDGEKVSTIVISPIGPVKSTSNMLPVHVLPYSL